MDEKLNKAQEAQKVIFDCLDLAIKNGSIFERNQIVAINNCMTIVAEHLDLMPKKDEVLQTNKEG
jgi:hypothetical protein